MGIATYIHADGDSGAPVFWWWWEYGTSTVSLLGVHSGSSGFDGKPRFSSWSYVESDLGDVDVKFTPTWSQVTSETANDVGVSSNNEFNTTGHVWIITNTPWTGGGGGYYIKRRNAAGSWDVISGSAVRIAVDPSGNAWVVNASNQIWKWTGTTWQHLGYGIDIGVGANGSVWRVSTTPTGGGYTVGVFNGSWFVDVPGGAIRIAVDPSGNPWVVANDNTIWRRVGGTFQQVAGGAQDIGISADGLVYVLGTAPASSGGGYEIFWWTGLSFRKVFGGGTAIAADRGGRPWVATSVKALWRGL